MIGLKTSCFLMINCFFVFKFSENAPHEFVKLMELYLPDKIYYITRGLTFKFLKFVYLFTKLKQKKISMKYSKTV